MRITYLLGAGASYDALPVVDQIPQRLYIFRDALNDNEVKRLLNEHVMKDKLNEAKSELIDSINWLSQESNDHASIDTFAKKLYLTNQHKDLNKLKLVLSIFFTYEQARNRPDKRYDSFFASILNELHKFPDNVRVLTWNYDQQFEIAYSQYSGEYSIQKNSELLKVNIKGLVRSSNPNLFSITKLNGATGFHEPDGVIFKHLNDRIFSEVEHSFLVTLIQNYDWGINNKDNLPTMSFAWEKHPYEEDAFLPKVIEKIKMTNVLVVIGYSFPFFNREFDRQILNSMEALDKVYIQDPNSDKIVDSFKSALIEINDDNIETIKNTDQFYLPREL